MKPRLYYVEWWDHMKSSDSHPDPSKLKPVLRCTVGWLVAQSKDHLVLVMDQSQFPDGPEYEYGFSIHRSLVVYERRLRKGKVVYSR